MAKLSDSKRKRVAQLIRDHHLAFTVEVLGEDAIPGHEFERLVHEGILQRGVVQHAQVAFPALHAVGKLSAASDHKLARMTPEQFWQFIEHAPPQFSSSELDAIHATKEHVGRLISGMGEDVVKEFDHAAHEDLAIVRHEIALGIARKQNDQQVLRRVLRKVIDTQRDWLMIIQTELHNAKEHGKALSLSGRGRDVHVFKRPRPDACRFCKLLYLVNGRPRIFKLSELVKNGTNYGKKGGRPTFSGEGATEWRPTIGSAHPLCQCELHEMPEGMTFDSKGNLVASGTRKSMEPDELTDALRMLIDHQCDA